MSHSVALEEISDNLNHICPDILNTSFSDQEFEEFFKNTLNKDTQLSLFLNVVIKKLDPEFKKIIPFIINNLDNKYHKQAIIDSNHALIIGKNEPNMSQKEILCSLIVCTTKNLYEIQQEQCSRFIPQDLKEKFTNALDTIKNPYKHNIRTKYNFQEKENASSSEIRINAVALDACKTSECETKSTKQKTFKYIPITEGAKITKYNQRNTEYKNIKENISKKIKPIKPNVIDLSKYF